MTVQFPRIQPTGHEFGEPEYATTETRLQSGVFNVRQWGDKAGDAPLTLEFANITQAAYQLIRDAYNEARGPIDDVRFPAIVGKALEDVDLFNPGPGLRWYWVAAPEGSRSAGGERISCRCQFRAELRISKASSSSGDLVLAPPQPAPPPAPAPVPPPPGSDPDSSPSDPPPPPPLPESVPPSEPEPMTLAQEITSELPLSGTQAITVIEICVDHLEDAELSEDAQALADQVAG
jgi:hypothetical protein